MGREGEGARVRGREIELGEANLAAVEALVVGVPVALRCMCVYARAHSRARVRRVPRCVRAPCPRVRARTYGGVAVVDGLSVLELESHWGHSRARTGAWLL